LPLPTPEGLPVLLGQFGLDLDLFAIKTPFLVFHDKIEISPILQIIPVNSSEFQIKVTRLILVALQTPM